MGCKDRGGLEHQSLWLRLNSFVDKCLIPHRSLNLEPYKIGIDIDKKLNIVTKRFVYKVFFSFSNYMLFIIKSYPLEQIKHSAENEFLN